jgi:patatin-like phospholipase/acyl hydrolase
MSKTFRILSIDGGGIRGIIPAVMMMELEKRAGQPISQMFDLIAGTSTGGILALGLTKPGPDGKPQYKAEDGLLLYEQEGSVIFQKALDYRLRSLFGFIAPRYPAAPLEGVLEKFFGETRLQEALTNVLITSYEIERRIPWFFRSNRAKNLDSYDFPMRQVARATSAAPTFFSPALLANPDGKQWALIDGGIIANNPTLAAYVDAVNEHGHHNNFLVVSLGTGEEGRGIPYSEAKNWGILKWTAPGIQILTHGGSETVHYEMGKVLPEVDDQARYYRLQVPLGDHNIPLDDTSPAGIALLKQLTTEYIDQNGATFDAICNQLKVPVLA